MFVTSISKYAKINGTTTITYVFPCSVFAPAVILKNAVDTSCP
jgi:hypothetical protein